MHHKHPLIHQLGLTLQKHLQGYLFYDAFSVNKNELVLVFNQIDRWLSIKLIIEARTFFVQFYDYPMERKGSTYILFESLKQASVEGIYLHENERSFRIVFKNNQSLVFKLYGSLANVLLFDGEQLTDLFRPQIESDKQATLAQFTALENAEYQPVLSDSFYIVQDEKGFPVLQNEATDKPVLYTGESLLEVYNEFSRQYLGKWFFTQKRDQLKQQCEGELKRWRPVAQNATQALQYLQSNARNEELGHIIMANLHTMQKGAEHLNTLDFYTNEPIQIKLKANLNPQENAQYYYKKARNQKNEEQLLANKIKQAQEKVQANEEKLAIVLAAETMRDLKAFELPVSKQKSKLEQREQYRVFTYKGFKILVGKSAANNDELTLKIAHKNDLWLHAKGVSGSHVIIKHQNKNTFTTDVITYAAQIAAYYSKSKGSAMVPVIYTPKKFVRKPKGAEPGQVFVEKEEILLVEPKLG
ncbi:MAG: NFACT RNA binding domain-containing protein [Bacteroidota bacterium]